MTGGIGKVVCVTGGSGFIASWIVKFLLQRGYTVTLQQKLVSATENKCGKKLVLPFSDPNNPKKVDHLLKLDGAKDRLQLFKADLLEEGCFDSIFEGCDGVFHTASPVRFVVNDPQAELLDPAVKGTLNVLKSCAKSPSVKRVVLTSSITAVAFTTRPESPDVVIDETWFSDAEFCREQKLWYILSKTLAEEAAWKIVSENSIDMVVINPVMVAGPLLQPEVNESVQPILDLINGVPFPHKAMGWVNVKDVADAHIQAYEIASASGRYCLSESVMHYSELARVLRDMYPTLQIADNHRRALIMSLGACTASI